jgi:hypothetical protein
LINFSTIFTNSKLHAICKAVSPELFLSLIVIVESNIFNKLFELYEKDNYILGIGLGKKVIQAEQECAKQCMINLDLDMNY